MFVRLWHLIEAQLSLLWVQHLAAWQGVWTQCGEAREPTP